MSVRSENSFPVTISLRQLYRSDPASVFFLCCPARFQKYHMDSTHIKVFLQFFIGYVTVQCSRKRLVNIVINLCMVISVNSRIQKNQEYKKPYFIMLCDKSEGLSILLIRGLCFVFSITPSNTRIIAGRTVTQQITPITTPFAITIPMSRPSAKVITHSARKPAIVVTELPATDLNVSAIACAIARSFGIIFFLYASKEFRRKME